MKYRISNLALFVLIVALVGCSGNSNNSDTDDDAKINNPPGALPEPIAADLPPEGSVEGVWRTRCFFTGDGSANEYLTVTYIRQGTDTAYVDSYHADRSCSDATQRSFYIRGTSEDIGTYVEPIFEVTTTSVMVTVDRIFANEFELQSTESQSFIDLVYRSGDSVVLAIRDTADPDSGIPQALNWNLPLRYVGPPVFPEL